MKNSSKPTLILASESPRRKQLLSEAGFNFEVVAPKVSEIPNENLNINDQILDIAERKAREGYSLLKSNDRSNFILISADTEVIYAAKPLGKPQSPEDAFRILRLLSGVSHEVKTAVCIINSNNGKMLSRIETTKIQFKILTEKEIWDYIATGEPMDKAGAYGIQGLGRAFVTHIDGSFDNVVGLPIELVRNLLSEISL